MKRTTTVIVVKTAKVFEWLGHMPILHWMLAQLKEVRGCGQVACVVSAKLAKRVKEALGDEPIDVVTIPDNIVKKNDAAFDKWLCEQPLCLGSEVVVVCGSTAPFLPAAKIEACLNMISRGFADTTCTTQLIQAYTKDGKTPVHAEMPGCRAFAPARLKEKQTRFRPVEVSVVEALNIDEPDSHRLAVALVNQGNA